MVVPDRCIPRMMIGAIGEFRPLPPLLFLFIGLVFLVKYEVWLDAASHCCVGVAGLVTL